MLIPIRCFTCGALIADRYAEFQRRLAENEEPDEVLDKMGIRRYCCRRMLLGNVDILDQLLPYYEALERRHAEFER